MSHSSNKTLLCNVKDTTSNEFQNSGYCLQKTAPVNVKNFGSINSAHINSTKESVSSSSRDASKHTPTEKRPAVTASQHKRNSWLSNLSSKFISTSTYLQSSHSAINTTLSVAGNTEIPASPSPSYIKCAVLAHAQKPIGDEPYIPALPRTSHQSFIQNAFRRLSSSNNLGSQAQIEVHHVNERKILNVDKNRRRCEVEGLNQSKLRRVAFCVDIQVMEGLKYHEVGKKEEIANYEENGKEKRNTILERSKSNNEGMKIIKDKNSSDIGIPGSESDIGYFVVTKKISRKKQKKKRNEEERKAKKDQKKKLAEAHGRVPLEVTINHSVASLRTSASSLKQEKCATLDPLRIYKRCCLLRETSALKRVAEQLADPTNHSRSPGVINRLDLTGYHMDMSDTVTFSDFLALVPVNDLVMENCGLNDECVRIILAGLLSTRHPELEGNKLNKCKFSGASQGGFVTRVVLKNNSRIGRDGWQYICTFIALCHSLKSIDLSKITIPQLPHDSEDFESPGADKNSRVNEVSCMLRNALSGRPGSCDFKLLNMAECGLSSAQIRNLVDGIIKAGLCRLGLAGNNIQPEGLQHIGRYLRNSHCEGLDLAGNNLKDQIKIIADSLTEKGSLHSLSLAKCNLSSESMSNLFPVLINLKCFKFINLSNNPELFSTEPSAIPLFRRYLPQMKALKKINLMSVSLTSDKAIALAGILPELPSLAHVNIMGNPLLDTLNASCAKIQNKEEEACALFASLMAAARVSKTLVCVDIEIPSPDSSEVVKALAKQVVAYCMWNMEHTPVVEKNEPQNLIGEKNVDVPDILLHLVGNDEKESLKTLEVEEPILTDEDYVMSGTGVVKALSICLSNLEDDLGQEFMSDSSLLNIPATMTVDRAKEMSKNLLSTARNIRSRLQLTVKESRDGDAASYHQTLETLIKRFEDEFPEMRLLPKRSSSQSLHSELSQISSSNAFLRPESQNFSEISACSETSLSDDETTFVRPVISRQNSDFLVAGRALSEEEGRMLRLSKRVKTDDLKVEIGSDEDEKPALAWSTLFQNCVDIFEGGDFFQDGLLNQATISNNGEK